MTIQFDELDADSRSGDDDNQTRRYFAQGSPDDVAVANIAKAAIPLIIATSTGNLYRQPLQYNWRHSTYCEISAPFSRTKNEVGSFSWGFDTTGGTVHIKASKETVGRYPGGAIDRKGAIGVNGDEVDGTDVIVPAMKFTVSFRHPAGALNLAKAFQLGDATGSVNSDTFFTKPAGTFLFLGSTGSDGSENEAECSYQFAYSRNLANEVIGGITVTEKQGWDYAWLWFESETEDGKPNRKPTEIHVERLYSRINFGSTFGFT